MQVKLLVRRGNLPLNRNLDQVSQSNTYAQYGVTSR
jgi:hypothetical protein